MFLLKSVFGGMILSMLRSAHDEKMVSGGSSW